MDKLRVSPVADKRDVKGSYWDERGRHAKTVAFLLGVNAWRSTAYGRNWCKNMLQMKTYMARPSDVVPKWWLVDATDKIVGRLASDIAMILMGKNRPTYTPHVDNGDYVIVTNVEKIVFTGKKWDQKQYAWYTGHPGQHVEKASHRLQRRPELVLREAVRRMLPKNKLAFKMLDKLKIYPGNEHPHQAQLAEVKELGIKD
jgi:large subunit ribosomal protein L13